MRNEQFKHFHKYDILFLAVCFFAILGCATPLGNRDARAIDLCYTVEKIKKINDSIYIIYASRNDSIFKIASYYDGNSKNCTKLKKRSKFRAKLFSLLKEIEVKFNMMPNYGISFRFYGVPISREPEKNIDDVYVSNEINGCYLIK